MRVAVTMEQCWHRVPGGTARAALAQVRALQGTGAVDLVGVAARHAGPPPAPWVPPVPVCQLRLPTRLLYTTWHHLRWPDPQQATGPVDVVHALGMAVPPRRAPLVVTVHDLDFLHEPAMYTRWGRHFFAGFVRCTRDDADLVLCSSVTTRDDCLAHGFPADRLRVVPLGVEQVAATPEARVGARAWLGTDRPFVLWVGTAEPRKNLATLVRAFRALGRDDLDLVLVGPTGWKEDVDALVAPIRDRVRLTGFVERDRLDALYAEAAVLCFPSLREGFGFPVLEAMVQGTPVVTSAGTSTEEVAGGAAVLVDPRDADTVAGGMAAVLDDPDRAAALADAGRARAATFTWERTARLTLDAYGEVAGRAA